MDRRENVIRQAVDESILSFNDQPGSYACHMAPYVFNGNRWKANTAAGMCNAFLMERRVICSSCGFVTVYTWMEACVRAKYSPTN